MRPDGRLNRREAPSHGKMTATAWRRWNPLIDDIQARLAAAFRPEATRAVELRYQFRFDTGEPFYLTIQDGTLEVHSGECHDPMVTVMFDCHRTALDVLTHRTDGIAAFMHGRLRSDGHLIQSLMLFARYFGPPTQTGE